jgi:hypothetical protein
MTVEGGARWAGLAGPAGRRWCGLSHSPLYRGRQWVDGVSDWWSVG